MCTLDKLLEKQNVLPLPMAMLIIQDTCYILKYIQSKEINHKAIDINNINISDRGEIKLVNIGIRESAPASDVCTDIYALGIILYKLLTGKSPYSDKIKYINPRKYSKSIPKKVCKFIKKMINTNPKKRYQNMDEVLNMTKEIISYYDLHELRVQLVKSVNEEIQYTYPVLIRNDEKKRKARKCFWVILFICFILFVIWESGLIHKYCLKKWYSPVNVEVVLPHSNVKKSDMPVYIYFYESNTPDSKKVRTLIDNTFYEKYLKVISFSNKIQVERPASKNKIYRTRTVFLKNGEYTAKIVVGSDVWIRSFTVNNNEVNIECDTFKNYTKKTKISAYGYDSETKKDITKSCAFWIFNNGEWIPFERIAESDIELNGLIEVRVRSNGYEEKKFTVYVDWYQDEIVISSTLTKK